MRYTLVWMLAAAAGLAAACTVDEEPTQLPSEEAQTATAAFALTAQCAPCALNAAQGPCLAQAQACLQDPNCANVGACVQNCAPNDAVCVTNCYQQASQLLDILADCVVCQQCAVECDGLWPCGGNGGGGSGGAAGGSGGSGATGGSGGQAAGACDNTGFCQSCVSCAAFGPCSAEVQACVGDPNCLMDPNSQKAQDAFKCTVCNECANDCANAPLPPSLQCP